MRVNEIGETPEGQKKLGALHAKREKQAFDAYHKGDKEKFKDYMNRSMSAYKYARDKHDKSDGDKNEMSKGFSHGTKIGKKKKLNEQQLGKIVEKIVLESVRRYLKESNDTQELCNMIKQIYKSVSLRYRMQEYEEVFSTAINNGYSKQDLIDAFKQCGLDCTTNPRSQKRFDEIWNSLGGNQLQELHYGGRRELHGDDPESWGTMGDYRGELGADYENYADELTDKMNNGPEIENILVPKYINHLRKRELHHKTERDKNFDKWESGQMNEIADDDDYSYEEPEDDWRSEEPSESDIMMAMKDIGQYCDKYKLRFRDLGNGEFGVMCNVGSDANVKGFMDLMRDFTNRGMLNNLGSGTTDNGVWHAKFKIIKCW